jgi:hypothetical protein
LPQFKGLPNMFPDIVAPAAYGTRDFQVLRNQAK